MQTKSEMINRIAELAKENAELKAENEKLKAQIKDLQIRKDRYYLKGLEQERQISDCITLLQEIKAIAENGTKTEDYLLGQRYTDLIDRILDLIAKTEEE